MEGEKAAAPAEEDAVPWQQLALPFLVPALGGLLFGLDIGATSGAVVNLTDPNLAGTTWCAAAPSTPSHPQDRGKCAKRAGTTGRISSARCRARETLDAKGRGL